MRQSIVRILRSRALAVILIGLYAGNAWVFWNSESGITSTWVVEILLAALLGALNPVRLPEDEAIALASAVVWGFATIQLALIVSSIPNHWLNLALTAVLSMIIFPILYLSALVGAKAGRIIFRPDRDVAPALR